MQILNPILPVMEDILGNLAVLKASGQITTQQIDYVPLEWFESERNILRKKANRGVKWRFVF